MAKFTVKNKSTGRTREVEADNVEELREDFPAENYEIVEKESGESKGEVKQEAEEAAAAAKKKGDDEQAAAQKVINESSLSDEDKEDIAERVYKKIQDGKSSETPPKEKEGQAGSGETTEGTSESSETKGKENEGSSEENNSSESSESNSGASEESGQSDKDKVAPQSEHFWFRKRGRKSQASPPE